VLSCVISYTLISFVKFINDTFIHNSAIASLWGISVISIILGVALSLLFSWVFGTKQFKNILVDTFNKSPHDDIWDNIIDFQNGSNIKVYLKDRDYYIIGHFKNVEEHGKDSWIAFKKHIILNRKDNIVIEDNSGRDAYIAIKVEDIEYVEVF
jgi:hypothetical protein